VGIGGGGGGFGGRGFGSNQSEFWASSGKCTDDAKIPKLNKVASAVTIHFMSKHVNEVEFVFSSFNFSLREQRFKRTDESDEMLLTMGQGLSSGTLMGRYVKGFELLI
jgi:hypothetical protein